MSEGDNKNVRMTRAELAPTTTTKRLRPANSTNSPEQSRAPPREVDVIGEFIARVQGAMSVFRDIRDIPEDKKEELAKKTVLMGLLQAHADSKHDFAGGNRCKLDNVSSTLPITFNYDRMRQWYNKARIDNFEMPTLMELGNERKVTQHITNHLPNFCSSMIMDQDFYELLHKSFGDKLAFVYDQGVLPKDFFTNLRNTTSVYQRINLHSVASTWDEAFKYKQNQVSMKLRNLPSTLIRYTSFADSGIEFQYSTEDNYVSINNGLRMTKEGLNHSVVRLSVAQLCSFIKAAERMKARLDIGAIRALVNEHIVCNNRILQFYSESSSAFRAMLLDGFVRSIEMYRDTAMTKYNKPVSYMDAIYGLCYDIKRSMDSGQADMVALFNEIITRGGDMSNHVFIDTMRSEQQQVTVNHTSDVVQLASIEKCFLVTGDLLCFTRAKIENVPAILLHPSTGVFTATVYGKQEKVAISRARDLIAQVRDDLTRSAQPLVLNTSLADIRKVCAFLGQYNAMHEANIMDYRTSGTYTAICRNIYTLQADLQQDQATQVQSVNDTLYQVFNIHNTFLKESTEVFSLMPQTGEGIMSRILQALEEKAADLEQLESENLQFMSIEGYNQIVTIKRLAGIVSTFQNEGYIPGANLKKKLVTQFKTHVDELKAYLIQYWKNAIVLAENINRGVVIADIDEEADAEIEDGSFAWYTDKVLVWETDFGSIVNSWDRSKNLILPTNQTLVNAIYGTILGFMDNDIIEKLGNITTDLSKPNQSAAECLQILSGALNSNLLLSIRNVMSSANSNLVLREMQKWGVSASMNMYSKMGAIADKLAGISATATFALEELRFCDQAVVGQGELGTYLTNRHLFKNKEGIVTNRNELDSTWWETRIPLMLQDMLLTFGVDASLLENTVQEILHKKYESVVNKIKLNGAIPLMRKFVTAVIKPMTVSRRASASTSASSSSGGDLISLYASEIKLFVLKPTIDELTMNESNILQIIKGTLYPITNLLPPPPPPPPPPNSMMSGGGSLTFLSLESITSSYYSENMWYIIEKRGGKDPYIYQDGTYMPAVTPGMEARLEHKVTDLRNFVLLMDNADSVLSDLGNRDVPYVKKEALYRRIIGQFEQLQLQLQFDYSGQKESDARDAIARRIIELDRKRVLQILHDENVAIDELLSPIDIEYVRRSDLRATLKQGLSLAMSQKTVGYPPPFQSRRRLNTVIAMGGGRENKRPRALSDYYAKYYKTYNIKYYS
jgi:hypothetical protein